MRIKQLLTWLCIALIFHPLPLRAQSPKAPQQAEEPVIPEALDFDQRQTEGYRFELNPFIGDYVGDKLGHSFITGLNMAVNLTPALSFLADFGYSPAVVDGSSLLGSSFTNKNIWLYDGALAISKPGAYRSKKGVVEIDLYSLIGGGILQINNSNRGAGFIGGGMKIYGKHQWFAIKVEVRNYFLSIQNPNGSNFESDFTALVGPVFRLPPRL